MTVNDHPPSIDEVRTEEDPLAGVTLLFVYNADSGAMNALKDYVHKSLSPATYPCSLCALTYGSLGMRGAWARFIDGLGVPVEFLHRDELRNRYGLSELPLPSVLASEGGDASVLIPADEIDALRTLEELKALVSTKVAKLREERSRD